MHVTYILTNLIATIPYVSLINLPFSYCHGDNEASKLVPGLNLASSAALGLGLGVCWRYYFRLNSKI